MSKGNNRSSNKSTTKNSRATKANGGSTGRPKPMTTKAGYTKTRRRYDEGGEWCW